jgi:hypothetical protein
MVDDQRVMYDGLNDKTYWTSRNQPTWKQLDYMCEHGLKGGPSFLNWFRQHVIYLFVLFPS